jgi:hypothetical protein
MWEALATVANTALNIWQKQDQKHAAVKSYASQINQAKTLAAEQLAITYNSIAQRSLEAVTLARREVFNIRSEQRAAEGQITTQAAQIGTTGRRASLAQKQATVIPAERKMAGLFADSRREQDALLRQADMEERAMINRLINRMPDAPAEASYDMVPDIITGAATLVDTFVEYRDRSETKKSLITDYTPHRADGLH